MFMASADHAVYSSASAVADAATQVALPQLLFVLAMTLPFLDHHNQTRTATPNLWLCLVMLALMLSTDCTYVFAEGSRSVAADRSRSDTLIRFSCRCGAGFVTGSSSDAGADVSIELALLFSVGIYLSIAAVPK